MVFAHHVNEFDASKRDTGSSIGVEAEHGAYLALDTAMILFNGVVHIFAGADGDGLSTLSQPALSFALHASHAIGLATINGDPLWPLVAGESLEQEAFGGSHVAFYTKIDLDHIAITIDGAVQIEPISFDLHIDLVKVPSVCHRALSSIEPVKQLWTEMKDPAMHSGIVHCNAAFSPHFLQIAQAQIVSQIPSHA